MRVERTATWSSNTGLSESLESPVTPTGNGNGRPFYTRYAWTYDLLIRRSVDKEVAAVVGWFRAREVPDGGTILDAGCGTGRYAVELAKHGYQVHGIDASADMLAEARRRQEVFSSGISLEVGDITQLSAGSYDAILCRGVLNDILDDQARTAAFRSFADALRGEGTLVFDVRDWANTVSVKSDQPVSRKIVRTDRGVLTFTSTASLDLHRRQVTLIEQHVLNDDAPDDFVFTMRCSSQEELEEHLYGAGFGACEFFGGYDPHTPVGTTDRIVAIARKGRGYR